jgi:hypothetical protein
MFAQKGKSFEDVETEVLFLQKQLGLHFNLLLCLPEARFNVTFSVLVGVL